MGGAWLNSSVLHGSLRESGWARPSYEPQLSANMKDWRKKEPGVCLLQEVDTALSACYGGLAWLWVRIFFFLDILDHL